MNRSSFNGRLAKLEAAACVSTVVDSEIDDMTDAEAAAWLRTRSDAELKRLSTGLDPAREQVITQMTDEELTRIVAGDFTPFERFGL